ncbi:uncharacterized protein PpBr36_10503 [Pyricularia pennisetigena]|uniref:uncharacterized protein n=1 Tax=Pyricularia pennisetigena TaxID=1578925 RepID=UPI00114E9CD5|nr:uncharacterized protein PpBr36_10503 [Pyricularia pennisetigena]TLS21058.1 hypothetical protein PpBr36_10503 [Pyricularia pennisetigena]
MRTNICLLAVLGVAPALIAAGPIPQAGGMYDYSIGVRPEGPGAEEHGGHEEGESVCGIVNPCEYLDADSNFDSPLGPGAGEGEGGRVKRQEQKGPFVCVNCDSIVNRGLRSCAKASGWQVNCDLPRFANLIICGGDCHKTPQPGKIPQPEPEKEPEPEKKPEQEAPPPKGDYKEPEPEKKPEHVHPEGGYKETKPAEEPAKEPAHVHPEGGYKETKPAEEPAHSQSPTYDAPPANCTEKATEHKYETVPHGNHTEEAPAPAPTHEVTHPTGTYQSPPAAPTQQPYHTVPHAEQPKEHHEEPKPEAHKEEPKHEQPKYEEPKHEQPKYEEPKQEEHKEQPVAEHTPVHSYQTVPIPSAEAPKHEEPKHEQPKYEEPKHEEHKHEEPKHEEPKYEEPKHEEHKEQPAPSAEYAPPAQPAAEEPKPETKRRKGKMTPAVGGDYGHRQ